MSRVLRNVLVKFQSFQNSGGCSVRHDCDMEGHFNAAAR